MKAKLLLIDDDANLCQVISYQLKKMGYDVDITNSGREGLEVYRQGNYDIVLTDIQMPDISGIQVLQEIRKQNKEVVIILITAYGSVENALEACRMGADDYITKPFGQEQLLFVIEKAVRLRNLQTENQTLREELSDKFRFENMIVNSPAMENVVQMAGKVARSDATVLILGESGTGKELLARGIHYNSPRATKPLVTVNCPSIPDTLLESELFGHVRGAFTGAIKDRKGKFEMADGGTLFLDEIADLREDVQAKLLRVLQEHEFERLGESTPIQVDVRLIAATNKDIEKLVSNGQFREDLYYRLSVVPITIPPLRERKADIPYLVEFFIERYKKDKKVTVDSEVLEILKTYNWPGNVRELENVIERALVLSGKPRISPQDLPVHLTEPSSIARNQANDDLFSDLSLDNLEKRAIQMALQKAGGNQTKAAKLLDIPRHVLLYRLKKFNIK
jgi:DNA-binding NtrC family response regulator